MSEEQKPYRVYRGGRVKGKVPLAGRPAPDQGKTASGDDGLKRPRRRRYGLWLAPPPPPPRPPPPRSPRAAPRRADSIMVLRTDPKRHRLAYLSIPRDLRVEIPGYGEEKINSAFQLGGPALALKTVRVLTGLQVNHVVIVDFADFPSVIHQLCRIHVDVPSPIVSNRFDCPYTEERCATWEGWRFEQGRQHMDGRRAAVSSPGRGE